MYCACGDEEDHEDEGMVCTHEGIPLRVGHWSCCGATQEDGDCTQAGEEASKGARPTVGSAVRLAQDTARDGASLGHRCLGTVADGRVGRVVADDRSPRLPLQVECSGEASWYDEDDLVKAE